jgi:hypothetical protein
VIGSACQWSQGIDDLASRTWQAELGKQNSASARRARTTPEYRPITIGRRRAFILEINHCLERRVAALTVLKPFAAHTLEAAARPIVPANRSLKQAGGLPPGT